MNTILAVLLPDCPVQEVADHIEDDLVAGVCSDGLYRDLACRPDDD
jgi:hypothetical protein